MQRTYRPSPSFDYGFPTRNLTLFLNRVTTVPRFSMPRESQLVEKIARALAPHRAASSRLKIGIGDDAAIISPAARTEWVLSCVTFLENVHFRLKTHPPDSVGYKALARASSDLAAMGATPRLFLLTLALPARRTGSWLGGFLRGMGRAARS